MVKRVLKQGGNVFVVNSQKTWCQKKCYSVFSFLGKWPVPDVSSEMAIVIHVND